MPKHATRTSYKKGIAKGRPKGYPNKFTTLKETFIEAFKDIGGREALAKFAGSKEGQKAFYHMIANMLPKDVHISGLPDIAVEKYQGISNEDLAKKLDTLIARKN